MIVRQVRCPSTAARISRSTGKIVADIVVWGIARSKLGFWMA